jgi:hypothetical protein
MEEAEGLAHACNPYFSTRDFLSPGRIGASSSFHLKDPQPGTLSRKLKKEEKKCPFVLLVNLGMAQLARG